MTRSFTKGLVIPRLFSIGRNVFYKSVCNCTLWALYCLLFIMILPYKQTYTHKTLKEDEARDPKEANKACE